MAELTRRHVVVVAGGISHERDVSLRSGRRVADSLTGYGWQVDLRDADASLLPALRDARPDVVWPALHGASGEDGALRGILEGPRHPVRRLAFDVGSARLGQAHVVRAGRARRCADPALGHAVARRLPGARGSRRPRCDRGGAPGAPRGEASPRWQRAGRHAGRGPARPPSRDGLRVHLLRRRRRGAAHPWDRGGGRHHRHRRRAGCTVRGRDRPEERDLRVRGAVQRGGDDVLHTRAPVRGVRPGCRRCSRRSPHRSRPATPVPCRPHRGQRRHPWFLEANVLPGLTETSLVPQALSASGFDLGWTYAELAEQAIRDHRA